MSPRFGNRFNGPRLSPAEAQRQGRVSTLAFKALGEREAVMAFLNTHNEALGGRPIDLAIASPEDLARVEEAIAQLAEARAA